MWKALLCIFGAFVVIAMLAPKDNQESSKNVITRYVNRDAIGAVNSGDIELLVDAGEHDDLAAEIALVDRGKALQVPKGTRVELMAKRLYHQLRLAASLGRLG